MRFVLIAMVLAATSTATIAQWYPDWDPRSPDHWRYLEQQREEFNKRQRDEEARNKAHAEEMYGQKPSSPSGGSSAGTGAGRTDFRAQGKELLRLPPLAQAAGAPLSARWFDALVAVGAGTLVAALTMATTSGVLDRQLTEFFEHNSYLAAHGRNIVNVILVDFRGLDTLGEIVVVATAGLAGFALIAGRRR